MQGGKVLGVRLSEPCFPKASENASATRPAAHSLGNLPVCIVALTPKAYDLC